MMFQGFGRVDVIIVFIALANNGQPTTVITIQRHIKVLFLEHIVSCPSLRNNRTALDIVTVR